MRLPSQHTRIRRDGTQGHGRDAADRTSVMRRATWQFPNRADAAEVGADSAEIGADAAQIGPTRSVSAVSADIGRYRPISAGIGRYRPESADIAGIGRNRPKRPKRPLPAEIQKKKKKKKTQNAPFTKL